MTIFKTPYETTRGTHIVTDRITSAIQESIVRDMIFTTNLGLSKSFEIKPLFVTGLYSTESQIPVFDHPLLVSNTQKNLKFLCFDFRPVISVNDLRNEKLMPKNKSEFDFYFSRAALSLAWLVGGENSMKTSLAKAGNVFASWLGETLAKRFYLDPSDQMKASILSHYYYQCLFSNDVKNDGDEIQNTVLATIQALRTPAELTFEVVEKATEVWVSNNGRVDLAGFCEALKVVTENIRLKDLNPGIVLTLTSSSWFGATARELLAVALEHPPTWCSIVFAAINQKTFKNSNIAKVAERVLKGDAAKSFNQAYGEFVETYVQRLKPKTPYDLDDF